MKDSDDLQRLIGLKRYESPGEEYFQKFREEFKDRQRSELLQCSARGLLAERVTLWMREVNAGKWLIPVGSAAAAIAVGIYISLPDISENGKSIPSFADSTPVADSTLVADSTPVVTPTDGEAIQLQLPRAAKRIPEIGVHSLSGIQGLIPAGSKESFREL